MEATNQVNVHAVQMLSAILKELKESKLDPSILLNIDEDLKKLAQYLTLNQNQVVVFSVIFGLQMNKTHLIDMTDIARYLDANFLDLLVYKSDIDGLISRRFLRTDGVSSGSLVPFTNLTFSIHKDVLNSIFMNSPITEPKPDKEMDACSFVRKVSDLIEYRSDKQIDTFSLFRLVEDLENANIQLMIFKQLELTGLDIEGRVFFYEMCDDFIRHSKTDVDYTLKDIYDDVTIMYGRMKEIKEQKTPLFKLGLINVKQANFISDIELELTEKSIELLLGENASIFKRKTDRNLIEVDKIAAKELFFDEKLDKQIRFVQDSLHNNKFTSMQQRLQQMAMPAGVAAIFYGEPGTGKTETVYQLAKQTGRSIMHVDISQSKSMWFGESERKIKDIFSNYASMCKSSDLKPILLFNEADAIFGKRKDGNASSVAQTENAIQNIILEEMEKLEGILIATTNLNQNLDAAFERRFLFKVKFDKPSEEAKQKIWKSKLAWLTDEEAYRLASDYSFSGGEIDNIVRKSVLEEILTGQQPDLTQISEYCDSEKFIVSEGRKKLGF